MLGKIIMANSKLQELSRAKSTSVFDTKKCYFNIQEGLWNHMNLNIANKIMMVIKF